MKRLFIISLLFVAVLPCKAQAVFSPDRPGVSSGTGIIHKGHIMLETGFESGHVNNWETILPTTLLRCGLSDYAEIRLEYDGVLSFNNEQWSYSVSPFIVGTKMHMLEGNGAIPDIAFMANLAIPCTNALCTEIKMAPSIYLLFNNPVNDWFSVGYNLGVQWNGISTTPTSFLAICLSFALTDKIGVFGESYNYMNSIEESYKMENNFDTGLCFCPRTNVQFDLYCGINLNDLHSYLCLGGGLAWMF